MAKQSIVQSVRAFQKEAEVERFYANLFDGTMFGEVKQHHLGIDILTRNLLIEVKFNRNIEKEWDVILAQALYYQNTLHTLGERVRPYLAVVDEDEVCIFEAEELRHIWTNEPLFSRVKGEIKRASDAHESQSLMDAIHSRDITRWYFHDRAKGVQKLQEIEQLDQPQQRPILPNNVIEAFADWEEIVRDYLKNNGIENAFIFYEDATGKGIVSSIRDFRGSRLTIIFDAYGVSIKQIPEGRYRKFEKLWKRLDPHSREAQDIGRRLYQLCEMDKRRSTGSFYTPYKLAKLAWEQVVQHLGEQFWSDGTWRIWDNCAGVGNLEYEIIPENALRYTYLSDKGIAEVNSLTDNDYFKGKCRGIFQFDWLNDYIQVNNTNVPKELLADIKNRKLKWLFFINPPYAEASGISGVPAGNKHSRISDEMKEKGIGDSANELAAQFVYRIEKEFGGKYCLTLFSKAKFITRKKSQGLRNYWCPKFESGFVLKASDHFIQQQSSDGLAMKAQGPFPIIVSLFNRTEGITGWSGQDWTYDEINSNCQVVGTKTFSVFEETRLGFRQYFFPTSRSGGKNKPIVKKMPVMGAVTPYTPEDKKQRGKILTNDVLKTCVGMILNFRGDFENQNLCYLTSGCGAGTQINEDNYKSILTGFALYKSVEGIPTYWQRDADIFYAPYRDLAQDEIPDCMLYALLNGANSTAYTTVTTESDRFILQNWFNPFDSDKFDWSHLSQVGEQAFMELTYYCDTIVQWRTLQTPYGNNKGRGVWLGLYQYRTSYDTVNKTYKKKFGVDYPNQDLYGIPYPDRFKAAIEALRQRVAALAIDLCLMAGKEITRTRNTFLEQKQQEMDW